MVTVSFLGTNGWFDSPIGNTVCALLESSDDFIILDAGFGIHKLDDFIPKKTKKRISLFLSHFHLDHIVGIHTLNKFKFKHLNIYGPKGTKKALTNIMKPPYTFRISDLSYSIEITELNKRWNKLPFDVDTRYLKHSVPCMGYRFSLDDRTVAYCTDTGVCKGLKELAKGVDLLIAECSYLPGEQHPEWPHLNPEQAARVAKKAGAKRLVLTHFDAGRYTSEGKRNMAGLVARKVFKDTVIAKDGMEITVD